MRVTQISSREVFQDKALRCPVKATLTAGVRPEVREGGKVWMVPVMNIFYLLDFKSQTLLDEGFENVPTSQWHFVEVVQVKDQQASLEGTLLEALQADPKYKVTVAVRGPGVA